MNIVALDSYAVNPGDLSWEPIRRLGEFSAFPDTPTHLFMERASGAQVLLVDHEEMTRSRFEQLPDLRFVGLFATGHDRVDLAAARDAGIAVANVPDYSTASVAQMTVALLLHLTNRVEEYDRLVHDGRWRRGAPFRYLDKPLVELAGKTIAIFGFGTIGTVVGSIVHAMGMNILGRRERRKVGLPFPVEWLSDDEFFRRADVISLHTPLNDETRHVINEDALRLVKRGVILVNTSRGGLVDDVALARALEKGVVSAAALDSVGDTEPPEESNPLLSVRNCVITPHVAWATRAARERCIHEVAANLEAFAAGKRRNRVD